MELDIEAANLPFPVTSIRHLKHRCPTLLGRSALVLASVDKVDASLSLLRARFPSKMVGSFADYEWLFPVLRYVVATPTEVLVEFRQEHCFHVGAIIFTEELPQAFEAAGKIEGFATPTTPRVRYSLPPQWLSPCVKLSPGFQQELKLKLPEAVLCPGLGNGRFQAFVERFAGGRTSTSCMNWSYVVAFIPGLIMRAASSSSTPSAIVVAPDSSTNIFIELLRAFASGMELKVVVSESPPAHIVVSTPAKLRRMIPGDQMKQLQQVVVLETDLLLQSGQRPEIESILGFVSGKAQLGFHSVHNGEEAEQLVKRFSETSASYSKISKWSLKKVYVFLIPVSSDEEKLRKLVELDSFLSPGQCLMAMVSSPARVSEVVEGLNSMGEPELSTVYGIHSGMSPEEMSEVRRRVDREYKALVVSDVYDLPNQMEIVVVDPPERAEDYLECAKSNRVKPRKLTVNLVTPVERVVVERHCESLGVGVTPLPDKLCKIRRPDLLDPETRSKRFKTYHRIITF